MQSLKPSGLDAAHSNKQDGITLSLEELVQLRYPAGKLNLVPQRKVKASMAGRYHSSFRGRGLDFNEVRPYQAGDDIRNIDWNVTARSSHNQVYTKVFQEERERPVYVLVDYRQTMHFASQHCLKSVMAARLAALIAWIAVDHGDRIGGIIVTDEKIHHIKPKDSHKGVMRFLHALVTIHYPVPGKTFHSASLYPCLRDLRHILRPGSLLFIASDFQGLDSNSEQQLAHLAKHNDLLGCFIYDNCEKNPPPAGYYLLTDGQHILPINTADKKFRQFYRDSFIVQQLTLRKTLQNYQIYYMDIATHEALIDNMHQHFATRQRHKRTASARN